MRFFTQLDEADNKRGEDPERGSVKLEGYWQREMSRLVYPVPELAEIVEDLKKSLRFLKG